MLQLPVKVRLGGSDNTTYFFFYNMNILGVNKTPGVFSRGHPITADLFYGRSKYLVKVIVECEKIRLNVVFPIS